VPSVYVYKGAPLNTRYNILNIVPSVFFVPSVSVNTWYRTLPSVVLSGVFVHITLWYNCLSPLDLCDIIIFVPSVLKTLKDAYHSDLFEIK
jgi:hypothetical protein